MMRNNTTIKGGTWAEEFAANIITALENGTAPWLKPWKAGEFALPMNPVSRRRYNGVNLLNLGVEQIKTGREDPRYMTYTQASAQGWQVRKGEHGRKVEYWQFSREEPVRDVQGKLELDADGNPVLRRVQLDRPLVRHFTVFHASQLDGVPVWDANAAQPTWNPVERVESLFRRSGVAMQHDQRDDAHYRYKTDAVHLPSKGRFASELDYYSVALHEFAHWTGGPERLNREFGPYGSEVYAREELRAEIATWMLCMDMGVPFNPGQHASYVQNWVKALKDDPHEIVRACRDAEKIKQYCLELEKGKEQETALEQPASAQAAQQGPAAEPAKNRAPQPEPRVATQRQYLNVPFKEKEQAKSLGARWDAKGKLWYAPAGADLAPLERWIPSQAQLQAESRVTAMSPQEEFGEALRNMGLDLRGELPLMDGKIHRVPLLDGQPHKRDGAYKGYLDGLPAGFMENHKTGERENWKYSGHKLSAEQVRHIRETSAQRREAEAQALREQRDRVAKRSYAIWKNSSWAPAEQPYLERKQVGNFGVKVDSQGNLIVPGRDASGFMHTIQTIMPDGVKRFEAGARKSGTFHAIDPQRKLGSGPVLVAEGYATAASVHMATQLPCIAAFDAGNLLSVAKALREQYPDKPIVIMADDDHSQENNPGLTKAHAAAEAVGGYVIGPQLTPEEKAQGLTDFNDVHVSRGLETVQSQVGPILEGIMMNVAASLEKPKQEQAQDMGMAM